MLSIRQFKKQDEKAVIELWLRCGLVKPQNDPRKDIRRKSKVRPDLFRVGVLDGKIVATIMIGYEGHRGWINYLAVDPSKQRSGLGRRMMGDAERLLQAAGCPKINLQVRKSNRQVLAFYQAIGYVRDDVVSLGKRLEHDEERPNTRLESASCATTPCVMPAQAVRRSPIATWRDESNSTPVEANVG